MKTAMGVQEIEQWFGCYAGTRRDLFLAESNAHPAKMGVALCYRIFEYCLERGWMKRGDLVLDPMCGQGTTLVVGATLGLRTVGVELEAHFIEMCGGNIDLLMSKMPEAPRPVVLHGDARRLREVLGCADGAISSPPYASDAPKRKSPDNSERCSENFGVNKNHQRLGRSLQGGGYAGAVTSPPYAGNIGGDSGIDSGLEKKVSGKYAQHKIPQAYDSVVTSPPYFQAGGGGGGGINLHGYGPRGEDKVGERTYSQFTVGSPDGAQIGNLKDPIGDIDAVVSSPPYAGHAGHADREESEGKGLRVRSRNFINYTKDRSDMTQIANLPDNDGDEKETYLSAMLQVYRELACVLKSGGVCVLVTKNPVKGGKIRRLDLDTIRLMEAAGFKLIEHKHAMLREDLGEQGALLGPAKKISRSRKSFFKRLHEAKYPELAVDFEDVLFFLKS